MTLNIVKTPERQGFGVMVKLLLMISISIVAGGSKLSLGIPDSRKEEGCVMKDRRPSLACVQSCLTVVGVRDSPNVQMSLSFRPGGIDSRHRRPGAAQEWAAICCRWACAWAARRKPEAWLIPGLQSERGLLSSFYATEICIHQLCTSSLFGW